jgi:hypothetical protein
MELAPGFVGKRLTLKRKLVNEDSLGIEKVDGPFDAVVLCRQVADLSSSLATREQQQQQARHQQRRHHQSTAQPVEHDVCKLGADVMNSEINKGNFEIQLCCFIAKLRL